MNGGLSQVRSDLETLHYNIHITTIRDHAALRLHLQVIAEQARALADEVKAAINPRRPDASRHLRDVVVFLEAVAYRARNLTYSTKTDLHEVMQSLRPMATTAVRGLSQAIAVESKTVELQLTPKASHRRDIVGSSSRLT